MQTNIASPGISSGGKNLFGISLTAALAGFIFGFDTVVISGADKPIQELWHTSPWFHGFFIMSMALWGTVVGALCGGIPTQKYGRKKVLIWIGILFTVSSIGSALASGPYIFSFFRFIGGLGIGILQLLLPLMFRKSQHLHQGGDWLPCTSLISCLLYCLLTFLITCLKALGAVTTGDGCLA